MRRLRSSCARSRHCGRRREAKREQERLLQEAREQSEGAAKLVAERAQVIYQRKQQQAQIQEKLAQVEEKVKTANANLAGFKKDGKNGFSGEDRVKIKGELEFFSWKT